MTPFRGLRSAVALLAACAAVLAAAPNAAAAPVDDSLLVRLDSGRIRGQDTGTARTFEGIRYAAAPVGPLRWAYPRPVQPWHGVADATKPGNRCPQQGAFASGTEDCLFLNVTAPRETTPGESLPVMVWIHGGGYTHDAGSLYDAQRLASAGHVIVVTINYRLGVFGYFGHPLLLGSGNFGLADQIAALQWTQRNAAAFGGDPDNVTLFGQSAGGMSTCALLTSPAARGLFDRVIVSSGSCMLDWQEGVLYPSSPPLRPYTSRATVASDGAALAAKLGCGRSQDAVDCLRGKDVSTLLSHTQEFANHLAFHTPLLPLDPAEALRLGAFHRVPVLSGGTRDEMRSYVASIAHSEPITAERYVRLVRNSFGASADAVLKRYPLSGYRSPALAWAAVTTDSAWTCPTHEGQRLLARHVPVYAYEFADEHAPNLTRLGLPGLAQSPQSIGAAHATDLPYLFDLGGTHIPLAPAQERLSRQMIEYWTTFARTGDPNGADSPHWPRYTGPETTLTLAPDAIRPAADDTTHHCDFWNGRAS